MPNRSDLVQVARALKRRLNGRAFVTLPRMEVTNILREVSGADTTRIKSNMAGALETALLEQGVRCYPGLSVTSTGDTVRLFHAGTLLGTLVDLIAHPSPQDDADLAEVLTKIKGKWRTVPVTPPTAGA